MHGLIARRIGVALALLLPVLPPAAPAGAGRITTAHFVVVWSDITGAEAARAAGDAERALAAVTAYLGVAFDRTIEISIGDRHRIPETSPADARIVVPASRIRGDAGGPPPIRGRGPTFANSLVYLVYPSPRPDLAAFLTEGLGIYLQERFERPGDRSYPAMGRDLHRATADLAARYGRLLTLAEARRHLRRRRLDRTRRLANLQAGSLVRYLIETHGLERFKRVYTGADFTAVYGKDLAGLAAEWRAFIGPPDVTPPPIRARPPAGDR